MYDTVNFWVDRINVRSEPFEVVQYLTDVSEHQSLGKGYTVTGKIGDYLVFVSDAGVNLKGSLAKLFLPTNIHTLTRAATREAIEMLSDYLHIPIDEAKVTRIDVSTVLPLKRQPSDYYTFLGKKPYFERLHTSTDTLYYNTQKKQLVFYNKIAEAKAKGVEVPMGFAGANLMRVEARFTRRLAAQFKLSEVTGATLVDETFYTRMIERWGAEYFSIDKLKSISLMDTTEIRTPKDVEEKLLAYFVQKEGGADFVNRFLADLRAKKTFQDQKYYSRLTTRLNGLTAASKQAEQSELILELDKAIREILLNCR